MLEPRREQQPRADPVHEEDQHERRHRDRQVVRGHDPGDAFDRRVEARVELGQREDDDRRVGERDRDGRGDRDLAAAAHGSRSSRTSP